MPWNPVKRNKVLTGDEMMINQSASEMNRAAAALLLLGSLACIVGAGMYTGRESGFYEGDSLVFAWERGLIAAAVIFTAIGFFLLEDAFPAGESRVLARIGAAGYFFAAVLVVGGEALAFPLGWRNVSVLMGLYTVMAYLAEACIGGALVRSRIVPPTIGWATIVWNLAWLLALPIFGWEVGYIPLVHHSMPLVIAIALLRRSR